MATAQTAGADGLSKASHPGELWRLAHPRPWQRTIDLNVGFQQGRHRHLQCGSYSAQLCRINIAAVFYC